MGRFLIIRVIKEHNADGYQNYDKWQCSGTWTSLYTLHPLLLYRSPWHRTTALALYYYLELRIEYG